MIGHYGRSYPEFWTGGTGRAMAKLPSMVRDLAHFLYSGPNAVKYGLYHKSIDIMAIEFGKPAAKIREALGLLASLEYAHFDETTAYVWVPQMAFYQLRPLPLKKNDYNVKAVRSWYQNLGRNPFLGEFFDRYDVDLRLSDPAVWPGTEVQRREWQGPAPAPVVALVPVPAGEPKRERRASLDARQLEADFESWWKHYPKKNGKLAARGEWMKAQPTRDTPLDEMIQKLETQKRSHDWTKEDGKWIPDPERYIKKGRWLDEVRQTRAPLARHNEGTLGALMDLQAEDEEFGAERLTQLPQRAGENRGRYKE